MSQRSETRNQQALVRTAHHAFQQIWEATNGNQDDDTFGVLTVHQVIPTKTRDLGFFLA